ncbi:hypothetical protein PoMZ_00613 [Pyricularia oryzae]|uniref:GPI ethanolamine phosphate transferase 2 n=1 Tax=Pyricularia oryzae TaxID=318829 RepID=A0A4P7N3V1_PYROR|nr:hypothetical protein PoMZ_00613 [Pyricularia oryzae]
MQPNREGLRLATVLLTAANIVIPIAILTFAKGFFPYKPSLPGLSKYEDVELGLGPPPDAPFDRLIFMVVDALRSDFVFSEESGFEFTQSLIRNGNAIPFTAHATSPTVTMPRIKAITTGSIPSFLDVILNINEGDESSSLASQDTWLAQMKAKATGKLVMHGDDTWLKLFPDTFDRADGTSSFFVADFTEVDNNVTRHITPELNNEDWNTLVLHYLGLDHIGHKGGPRSPYMLPKQREMDHVVKEIYSAIESQPALQSTVLVVCGDHGMNDAGNHGASSPGETSPALVFMSPKFKALQNSYTAPMPYEEDFSYYNVVEQSDLAPTLGALLGFPVPRNNLGALIPDFLPFWPSRRDKTQLLLRNARQILGIVEATYGDKLFTSSLPDEICVHGKSAMGVLACEWKKILETAGDEVTSDREFDAEWVPRTVAWLREAQGIMSSMASNYDMQKLKLGQSMSVGAIGLTLGVPYLLGDEPRSYIPLSLIRGLYSIMMFASSYVEEEHHFWYWFTTAWLAYIGFRRLYFGSARLSAGEIVSIIVGLLAMRLLRSWNQTGQKFAGDPDIVKIFLKPSPTLLWTLILVTYFWIYRELLRGFSGLPTPINITGTTTIVLAALSFKLAFTYEESPEIVPGFAQTLLKFTAGASLLNRARAVFFGLAVGATWVIFSMVTKLGRSNKATGSATLHHLFTLFAMAQSRATNVPLFLILDVIFKFISSQPLTPEELSTTTLLLQFATFFAFGGTNSISSVDLSSAYNGISDFNVVAVGILTFVGNWAGAVYWTFATNTLLLRKTKAGADLVFSRHVTVLTMFTAASVGAIMVACTVMRTHLFIWTVFSPKYLYCMAWTFGQHLVVNVGLGGLLYWLCLL